MTERREHLTRRLDHDLWANRKVLDAVRELPEDRRGEAQRILSHLVTAQKVWLGRITGTKTPDGLWPELTLDECEETLERLHSRLVNFLDTHGLEEEFIYTTTSGTEYTNTLDEIVTHLINHSSHHRGQINREISRAGGNAPLIGFIHYARGG